MPVRKQIVTADIVNEGKEILKKCRKFRKEKKDHMTDDDHRELHKKMVSEHHDFASVYMIPLRSIVYTNEYFDDVMDRYVTHIAKNPWNSRREFLERQADYLIFLYRKKNTRHGAADVARYKEQTIKNLVQEDDKMREYEKEVKETVEKEFDDIVDGRRKILYERLKQLKQDRDNGKNIDTDETKAEVAQLIKDVEDVQEMKALIKKDSVPLTEDTSNCA